MSEYADQLRNLLKLGQGSGTARPIDMPERIMALAALTLHHDLSRIATALEKEGRRD